MALLVIVVQDVIVLFLREAEVIPQVLFIVLAALAFLVSLVVAALELYLFYERFSDFKFLLFLVGFSMSLWAIYLLFRVALVLDWSSSSPSCSFCLDWELA